MSSGQRCAHEEAFAYTEVMIGQEETFFKSNGKRGGFRLDVRKKFITRRAVRLLAVLPREALDAPGGS